MLAHALLEYFLSRKAAGVIRVSRASIPLPPRGLASLYGMISLGTNFREPRNNTLREGLKITDEITFFDAFEERPKFRLR